MRDWWLSRQPRERLILMLGGILVVATLLYLLVWEPLVRERTNLANRVKAQGKTLVWMQQASEQVKQLRSQSQNLTKKANQSSLMSIVDSSAKRSKIRKPIQRIEPEGKNGVKLWIENVDFDTLVRWLGEVERRHGVLINRATITRNEETAGQVNSRLSLERP
jgi:general secretion pathway protein M